MVGPIGIGYGAFVGSLGGTIVGRAFNKYRKSIWKCYEMLFMLIYLVFIVFILIILFINFNLYISKFNVHIQN